MMTASSATGLSRTDVDAELEGLFRLDGEDAGELLLVRHARPATRVRGEAPADPMLSCEGLEQAERLATRLDNLWVEAVYTAPERRALQTARVVAGLLNRPLHVVDALADVASEGPPRGCRGSYAAAFVREPRWTSLSGFEPSVSFRRRVLQAIEAVAAAHPARRSVVVTHTSVINAYLSAILGVPGDLFFAPDFASISTLRHAAGLYALRSLNDTGHLPPAVPAGAFQEL
jgi:probable phosphoglycerate mutase